MHDHANELLSVKVKFEFVPECKCKDLGHHSRFPYAVHMRSVHGTLWIDMADLFVFFTDHVSLRYANMFLF